MMEPVPYRKIRFCSANNFCDTGILFDVLYNVNPSPVIQIDTNMCLIRYTVEE
jgi:hypothetical protein